MQTSFMLLQNHCARRYHLEVENNYSLSLHWLIYICPFLRRQLPYWSWDFFSKENGLLKVVWQTRLKEWNLFLWIKIQRICNKAIVSQCTKNNIIIAFSKILTQDPQYKSLYIFTRQSLSSFTAADKFTPIFPHFLEWFEHGLLIALFLFPGLFLLSV